MMGTGWPWGMFGLAAASAVILVGGLRRWAEHYRFVDIPNARSSHTRPTAKGGGIVIVALALFTVGSGMLVGRGGPALWGYVIGAVVVGTVSVVDDWRSLPPWIRMVAQGGAAGIAVAGIGAFSEILVPGIGVVGLGSVGYLVTVAWIIGLTNAYNFMDGIDGLAAVQGVIAGTAWAFVALFEARGWPLLELSIVLAGSSLGFLYWNWSPARIFMGDVGSTFLGYSFALLPLFGLPKDEPLVWRVPVVAVAFVWLFVFDTIFTFLRRARRGEALMAAHRSHLYQRLLVAGWSHRRVVCVYGTLSIGTCLVALAWLSTRDPSPIIMPVALVVPAAIVLGCVRWTERRVAAE